MRGSVSSVLSAVGGWQEAEQRRKAEILDDLRASLSERQEERERLIREQAEIQVRQHD